MAARQPKIAIVGGGIGGLFAANALLARGFEIAVYEQAAALGEVGAGLALAPNSMRHLRRLGLETGVERWGVRFGPGSHYFRHDGTPIASVQVTDSSGSSAMLGMHRADLVNILAAALPPTIIHTEHRCTGFAQRDDGAQVTFANGVQVEADIVVGADGIHSALRPYVTVESTPQFHGTIAYRGTFPHGRMKDWPMDRWQMWLGPGKHFLAFPLRAGRLINYVGFVPADGEMKESWSAPGDPDLLRAEFAGWDLRIEALLRNVETTFRWALYDREPLPTWSAGRLTLLGDAAHPMLPHLGQGANQSIEDGMALATILAHQGGRDIPAGLLAYERLRRERVAEIQRGARQNGLRYDSAYSDLAVRDAEIRAQAAFRRAVFDYDVVPAAEAAIASS